MNTRVTDSFKAADAHGNEFSVSEYTEFVRAGTMSDPDAVEPGLKFYELSSSGEKLNPLPDGTFKVVSSDLVLHRI